MCTFQPGQNGWGAKGWLGHYSHYILIPHLFFWKTWIEAENHWLKFWISLSWQSDYWVLPTWLILNLGAKYLNSSTRGSALSQDPRHFPQSRSIMERVSTCSNRSHVQSLWWTMPISCAWRVVFGHIETNLCSGFAIVMNYRDIFWITKKCIL